MRSIPNTFPGLWHIFATSWLTLNFPFSLSLSSFLTSHRFVRASSIMFGNFLHKSAVLSGLGCIVAGLVPRQDATKVMFPLGATSAAAAIAYGIFVQGDPLAQYVHVHTPLLRRARLRCGAAFQISMRSHCTRISLRCALHLYPVSSFSLSLLSWLIPSMFHIPAYSYASICAILYDAVLFLFKPKTHSLLKRYQIDEVGAGAKLLPKETLSPSTTYVMMVRRSNSARLLLHNGIGMVAVTMCLRRSPETVTQARFHAKIIYDEV